MGYFWGMIGGLIGATFIPPLFPDTTAIYLFPLILLLSLLGCLLGTFLSPAEDEAVLKNFYRKTRPWGFWKPIKAQVMAESPDFVPNQDFRRDVFNLITGITWQMTLVVMPMYLMIRQSSALLISFLLFLSTSWLLKKYWWNQLDKR